MDKRFIFADPEQLKEVEIFCKEGSVSSTARVWAAAQRRDGQTRWDGNIGIRFYTKGRQRRAEVYRGRSANEYVPVAKLKFLPALEWCKERLLQAE